MGTVNAGTPGAPPSPPAPARPHRRPRSLSHGPARGCGGGGCGPGGRMAADGAPGPHSPPATTMATGKEALARRRRKCRGGAQWAAREPLPEAGPERGGAGAASPRPQQRWRHLKGPRTAALGTGTGGCSQAASAARCPLPCLEAPRMDTGQGLRWSQIPEESPCNPRAGSLIPALLG